MYKKILHARILHALNGALVKHLKESHTKYAQSKDPEPIPADHKRENP